MAEVKHIVLYDGICTLCWAIVNFIKTRDNRDIFSFVPFRSEKGKGLLDNFGLQEDNPESVIYIRGKEYFRKSSAVLYMLKDLGSYWKLFFIFMIIPPFIRDYIYTIIARNRHRISCRLYGEQDKHN